MTSHVVPGNTIIVLVVEHGQAGLVVELLEALDGDADVVLSIDGSLLDTFVVVWLRLSLPEIIQTLATLQADAETMPATDHQLTSVGLVLGCNNPSTDAKQNMHLLISDCKMR